MTWIGHVDIPLLLSENLSQNRQVIQRNYYGEEPTTYQFSRNLEQGDIPFALHVATHANGESLDIQRDSVFALVRQKAALNPFEFQSEQGHLSVNSVNVERVPSQDLLQGSMSVRYLPDSVYQPGTYHNPTVQTNDYSVTASGIWPVPSTVTLVEQRDRSDGSRTIQTTTDSITTPDGTLDLYAVGNHDYLYEYPDGSYTDQVRTGQCKVYNHNGSATESNWTRIYDNFSTEENIVIESGIIRIIPTDPTDSLAHMYFYDGSTWNDVGTLSIGASTTRLIENSPDIVRVRLNDLVLTIGRGAMFAVFETSDVTTEITLDTSVGDNAIDAKYDDTDSGDTVAYMTGDNSGISFTYYAIKPTTDGDKTGNIANGTLALENLTQSHTLQFGVVPSSFTESDVEAWALTEENTQRNLLQRSVL